MPKVIIHKDGNQYYFLKEAKAELSELYNEIKNISCINSNQKINRKRTKLRPNYGQKEAYKDRKMPYLW